MAIAEHPRTVRELMTPWVHVTTRHAAASGVVRTMLENGITAMPVIDSGGKPVGIVYRSGLLPAAAVGDAEKLTAGEVMDPLPPLISAAASLYQAAARLRECDCQHLLVVDAHGRLSGIVSRGEVTRALLV